MLTTTLHPRGLARRQALPVAGLASKPLIKEKNREHFANQLSAPARGPLEPAQGLERARAHTVRTYYGYPAHCLLRRMPCLTAPNTPFPSFSPLPTAFFAVACAFNSTCILIAHGPV